MGWFGAPLHQWDGVYLCGNLDALEADVASEIDLAEAFTELRYRLENGIRCDLSKKARNRVDILAPKMTWIYFVASVDAGAIKVGRSRNVLERMSSLTTSSPVPLTLVAMVQYRPQLEHEIHAHLSEYRKRGEWFHADEPVIELARIAKREGLRGVVKEIGLKANCI